MTDATIKSIRTITMSVLIGFLSGVGVMAMSINGDVREHGVLISRQSRDLEMEKARTDARIFELASMIKDSNALVRASIEQTTRLILTIEAQSKMIQELRTNR